MSKSDGFFSKAAKSAKSMVKVALQSRPAGKWPAAAPGERLIVMGNGPSLAGVIAGSRGALETNRTLAVNFAANTPEFFELKPDFYVLADPVFFAPPGSQVNVDELWTSLGRVDWPMTLFVPSPRKGEAVRRLGSVRVCGFNFVGLEGFEWLEGALYSLRLGMPRPRNVLIPSVMAGIWMGFREIYIVGADHSWTRTLEVDDDNTVVSVQPHFYKDNESEHSRVKSLYKGIRLHELMYSFYVAFKSYFAVGRFARRRGCSVYNSTAGSFIDAFERRPLPSVYEHHGCDGSAAGDAETAR